ncbi:hypothetical protein [Bifidobacterium ruminantium]|uniref:hypothetical protein n=1 Tax=Bifidobacterium ruminantium TaxID=78346 RepID=UPI001FD5825F|nr:hypothetical protein [Bifidobacterium ruminantium]
MQSRQQTAKSQKKQQKKPRRTNAQQRVDTMLGQAYARRRLAVPKRDKDRRAFQRRLKTGEVVMPYKGMYIAAAKWESLPYAQRITWALRTVCHTHPGWVLCGPSAAGALGFTTTIKLQRYVHIAVPKRSQAGRHGYVIAHFYKDMPAVKTVDGMRVTAEMDTMMDCGRMLDFEHAMVVCCTGLRLSGLPQHRLREYARGRKRISGIPRARYVAEHADPACENGGEATALAAILEVGACRPRMQATFVSPLSGGEIRADFLWERDDGSLVVGELDGRQKYVDPSMMGQGDSIDVILREKDRETQLNMLRVDVVRFQMEHVRDRGQLRQRLQAAGVPFEPVRRRSPFSGFRCKAY